MTHNYKYNRYAADGLDLFFQTWTPLNPARGVVCLVHGMHEYSGRYHHLADALAGAGFVLMSFDLRGHGRSKGIRGDASSYSLLMDDILMLLYEARYHFPAEKCFLMGHSLGGNLVLNYVLRHCPKIAGVVALSPWLTLSFDPPKFKVMMASMMEKTIGFLPLSTDLDLAAISRLESTQKAYASDPLIHRKMSPRMFIQCRDAGQWALENAQDLTLPLLLIHGGDDRITSSQASQQFAQRASGDVTFSLIDQARHELLNEPERVTVMQEIVSWLNSHMEEPQKS